MSAKKRLNERLEAAARLRVSGQFDEADAILAAIAQEADVEVLGHRTSLGVPRRLHSALLKLAKARGDSVQRAGYQYHLVPPPALLEAFVKFTGAERRDMVTVNREPVPHMIHQIWIGPNPPPATAAWAKHAARHGYDYRLWQEEDLQELGLNNHPMYRDMISRGDFPGAVDVARYVIMEKIGGIYLDCDWYPARNDVSFHDLLPLIGLTTMAEDIPRNTGKGGLLLANSVLASPPNHPVFTRLLDALNDVMTVLPNAPAWWTTGPLIFTLMGRGGTVTLADADFVAGFLPQQTPLADVEQWCQQAEAEDKGMLLLWKSWVWP